MAIEYNPNKEDKFYGYINTAASNLRTAENKMADIVNNCEFPSKTIIGRRFGKKSVIESCKSSAASAHQGVSTVGANVRKQVADFLNADKRVKNIANSLNLSLTGAIGNFLNKKGEKRGKQTTNLNWTPSYMQGTQANIVNTDGLNWAYSYQSGGVPVGGYKGYSNYTLSDFWRDLKKTGATICNGIDAFSEGATEMFFGGGDKAFELGGRLASTPYYALKDAWTSVTSGGKKKGNNLENAWNSTMEYVADTSLIEKQHILEHNQDSYKKFEKYVYDPFKYGRVGYNVAKTLGGIFGTATGPSVITGAPAITTAGFGTKYIPMLSTGLTAGSRGTSEYWQGKKRNSMEGIKEAYKYGEITKEQYDNIIKIRNMSDSEWKKIEKQINASLNSGMKKDDPVYKQYLQMKNIREMPEEWKNDKVLYGGLKYGTATAIWETAQFGIGGNLSKYVKLPLSRIAINTSFNALDPVARASFKSQIDKTSFTKEFDAQGGTGAVLVSGAVGLAGSSFSEYLNYKARKASIKRTSFYLVEQEDGSVKAQFNEPKNSNARYIKTYMDHPANMTVEEAFASGNYAFDEDLLFIANYNKNRNATSQFTQDIIDEDNIIDLEYNENGTYSVPQISSAKNVKGKTTNLAVLQNTRNFVDTQLSNSNVFVGNQNTRIANFPALLNLYSSQFIGNVYKNAETTIPWAVKNGLNLQFFGSEKSNLSKDFNKIFPETINNGKRNFSTIQNDVRRNLAISKYFSDPKGYAVISTEINIRNLDNNKMIKYANRNLTQMQLNDFNYMISIGEIDDARKYLIKNVSHRISSYDNGTLLQYASNNLNEAQRKDFYKIYAKERTNITEAERQVSLAFAASAGPALEAYLRRSMCNFTGLILNGNSTKEMSDYIRNGAVHPNIVDYYYNGNKYINISMIKDMTIEKFSRIIDKVIEDSPPIKEPLVVIRNADKLFSDGTYILNPEVGMVFDDKANLSTSLSGKAFSNRKYRLEIEIPEGTKVAYLEPLASAWTNYSQQEILLGRNNQYIITDKIYDTKSDTTILRARLIPTKESNLPNITDVKEDNSLLKYYNRYSKFKKPNQYKLSDVIKEMEQSGTKAMCEAELREVKNLGIYDESLPGHGIEHIENVTYIAAFLAEKEGLDEEMKKLVIEAAKFHDASKSQEGHLHGLAAADYADDQLRWGKMPEEDIAIVKAAIEYHSIGDNPMQLESIFKKYNVTSGDYNEATKVALVLKDADALDRTRFPGNLDERYLRTESGRQFVQAAYEMQELKAQKKLEEELLKNNVQKQTINKLRGAGVSDYEIAFWSLLVGSNENKDRVGLWYSLNEKISKILN